MFTIPVFIPVTTPEAALTVAMPGLLDANVTLVFEAFVGLKLQATLICEPIFRAGNRLTELTNIDTLFTVTLMDFVARLLEIVAVPLPIGVTTPCALTDTTAGLEDVHVDCGTVLPVEGFSVSVWGFVLLNVKLAG